MKTITPVALATLVALGASPAAAQKLTFTLNWVAGGDHAPYFYAQKMGWYKDAGLDIDFETGRGSAASAQKVGSGQTQLGLSDMAGVLLFRGKGADNVGIMNVYANSPQGLYWLKSSGIAGVKDLAGKKIGNPAGDGARTMWPALAKRVGIDPASVTWVNIDANAKLGALKARTIDATTSFFNLHHVFARELGSDMGFLAWKDAGVNPYGNSIIANGTWRQTNASRYVRAFQSRRSLLTWKIFGQRLDGWSNADHPTETVPGNPATLPPGTNLSAVDLDYTGTIMPPPGSGVPALTENQKMTIARWIDLGCPIDQGPYGWFLDDLKPTLTVSAPRPGRHAGTVTEIVLGAADGNSGLDAGSLSVTADFPVAGRAPGTELADLATPIGDGIWRIAVSPALAVGATGTVRAEVRDLQGNVTRVAQRFRVVP